jgi:hypothetical protein
MNETSSHVGPPTHQEIAELAYWYWELAGRPEGHRFAVAFWLGAEAKLMEWAG